MIDNDLNGSSEEQAVGDSSGDSSSTPNSEQENSKTPQQLEEERSRAVAEMHKFMQKEKQARAESSTLAQEKEYLETENLVLKDNGKIVEVYENNPELAEQICQSNWGVTYAQLVQQAQSSTPDLDSLVDKKLSERELRKEMERVEVTPLEFLADKGLNEKSSVFQEVMREYNEFPAPTSVKQAKKLVAMLYAQANGDEGTAGDINSVYTPSTREARESSQQPTRKVSESMRKFMEQQYGADSVKKFLSSK